MKNIAILYSFNTNKTKKIAQVISHELERSSNINIKHIDIDFASKDDILGFDNYILGVPTWFDGELPIAWDEFLPSIDDTDFTGKKIAIFGLADQKGYPDNFADGIGLIAKIFEEKSATIIGHTSTDTYIYNKSLAEKNKMFQGLVIDIENQNSMTNNRIEKWAESIQKEII
ncbi:MAG: flavodoxin [Marinifilaceae bacterium]|jgi:flavodoxin I|nr:flavodoxin [Marinifilaceae bacterium]